jgi:hypothetical protein
VAVAPVRGIAILEITAVFFRGVQQMFPVLSRASDLLLAF